MGKCDDGVKDLGSNLDDEANSCLDRLAGVRRTIERMDVLAELLRKEIGVLGSYHKKSKRASEPGWVRSMRRLVEVELMTAARGKALSKMSELDERLGRINGELYGLGGRPERKLESGCGKPGAKKGFEALPWGGVRNKKMQKIFSQERSAIDIEARPCVSEYGKYRFYRRSSGEDLGSLRREEFKMSDVGLDFREFDELWVLDEKLCESCGMEPPYWVGVRYRDADLGLWTDVIRRKIARRFKIEEENE